MTTTKNYTDEYVDIGGGRTHIKRGGSGSPILYLHGETGNQQWNAYIDALAQNHTVYVPSHPGYDESDRLPWVNSITDVVRFYIGLMKKLDLNDVALVGHSMGGWIAAELSSTENPRIKSQALLSPAGIRPREGDITEILMAGLNEYVDKWWVDADKAPKIDDLSDEEKNVLWTNREMDSRLLWKPYMHNPVLPMYLEMASVPTLILFGAQDGIIPVNSGEIYQEAIPGSKLQTIDRAGHSPQDEQPDACAKATLDFLASL